MSPSETYKGGSKTFGSLLGATARILLTAGIVTSSIDILLTLNLGGANTRLVYFLTLVASFLVIRVVWERRRLIWPYTFGWIATWVGLNTVFIPNSPSLIRGLLYGLVLIASLVLVWDVTQVFDTPRRKKWLLKAYVWGFVGHALIGLAQFVLWKLGFDVLSQESDDYGRLNGLTHEPSAFAGFEIFGYVLLRELMRRRVMLFSLSLTWFMLMTVSMALVLSTSKTAWLFMLIYEGIIASLVFIKTAATGRINVTLILVYGSLLGIAFVSISTLVLNPDLLLAQIAFSGTGVSGTASHSFDDRFLRTLYTIQAAWDNSIIGTSYGGVGPYIHQSIIGNYDVNIPLAELSDSMFTPAEVWAGTGMIGFMIWTVFLFLLSIRSKDFDKGGFERNVLGALSFSAWIGMGASTSDFTRGLMWAHIAIWVLFATRTRSAMQRQQTYQDASTEYGLS